MSVLASVFLHLSLASGILSMQTRLKNLQTLLYDFCEVAVLLLTLVGLFLPYVNNFMKVREFYGILMRGQYHVLGPVIVVGYLVYLEYLGSRQCYY